MYHDVYRGVITRVDGVKVRATIPSLLGTQETDWADPIFDKADPVVGDKVWVVFEGGSPTKPRWLKQPAPPDLSGYSLTTHDHDAAYVNEGDHTKAQHTALGLADATNANATQFDPGPFSTAAASYPVGLSYGTVLVADGWPSTGTILTVNRADVSRWYQEFVTWNGTYRFWRTHHTNHGFTAWQLVGPEYGPQMPDTRTTNPTPQQFDDLFPSVSSNSRWDFKNGSAIGLASAHYGVHTIAPWGDDSGGGMHQVAYGPDGQWHRYGTRGGGWGIWKRVRQDGWDLLQNNYLSANFTGTLDYSLPAGYSQIRVVIPWIRHTGGTANTNLYMRLNGDTAANYGGNLLYHTTGAESGTYYSALSQAYLAYSYFYGNSYGGASFDIDIRTGGARGYIESTWWNCIGSSNSNSYGYGGVCKNGWHNGAGQVTRIQIWNAGNYAFEAGSRVLIYGKRQS